MQNQLFIKSFVILVLVGVVTGIGIARYTDPQRKVDKASKELGAYMIELQTGGIPLDKGQSPTELRNFLIEKAIEDNKVEPTEEDQEGFSISLSQSFAARTLTQEACIQNQNTQCLNLLTSVAKNGGQTATQKRYNEAVARTEEPPACKETNNSFYGKGKNGLDCAAYNDGGIPNCNSPYQPCSGQGNDYIAKSAEVCVADKPPKSTKINNNSYVGIFDESLTFKDLLFGLISPNATDLNKYEGKLKISDIQDISITRILAPSSDRPENVLKDGSGSKYEEEPGGFSDDDRACAQEIKTKGKNASARCKAAFCGGEISAHEYVGANTTKGDACNDAAKDVVACLHDYQQTEQGAKDLRDAINLKPVVQAQQQAIDRCRSTLHCIGDINCPRYDVCRNLPTKAQQQQQGSTTQPSGGGRRR